VLPVASSKKVSESHTLRQLRKYLKPIQSSSNIEVVE